MAVVLALAHAGVGAVWLGSMAYSLLVVQPRIRRVLDAGTTEEVYRELAAGNRWRVVGLIGVLAVTGLGLVATDRAGATALWWILVTAKAALLCVAGALFWWVSWRGWPRRIFALPEDLPPIQRRFRAVALAMAALVGAAFALGVLAARA